jgi:hypothetical protein
MSSRQLLNATPFFQPSVDRNGATFVLPDHVYRALRGESAKFYRSLLRSNDLKDAFEAGLVRCWEADVQIEGFELVIECERVPVVSYPMEWPTAMLKEAALCIARVGAALTERGLGLQDAHPWNVLFDGPRAAFVDIGSIVPGGPVGPVWTAEFRRHLLVPLALRRLRLHAWADDVVRSHRATGAKALWDARLLRPWFPPGFERLSRRGRDPAAFFAALQEYVNRLPDGAGRSEWSDYEQSHGARVDDPSTYQEKQQAVDALLRKLEPGLLLDLGANAGWYSELAARRGQNVIAVDTDDWTLSHLYRRVKKQGLSILPMRLDIMWPTGSYGMALSYQDAYTRLRADTSMALALLHHLAGSQRVSFETFAYVMHQLSRKTAIVEFIPREDAHVSAWPLAREPWYDLNHLIQAMRPYFPKVEVVPSSPAPRQLLLFQRGGTAA